jgi:hypothetical protein
MHTCIATTGGSKSALIYRYLHIYIHIHNTYIYIYIYIYTHIRTYTYIYIQAYIGLKRIDMIVISIRTWID